MERIGRYELGRELGRGGAGTVHEATLRGPGDFSMPVALKVLHQGGELLRREARIGGLLRHRHLVDVYEIGQADGRWFCALELCRGGTLRHHLPLPPRAVIEVGLAVCSALQYAHEALDLVHLDLKPDNLLLSVDGVVKVADLGIARAKGFDGDGRIRGTLGYMPPEQARGEQVDRRADIYALGITLVELATGGTRGASGTLDLDSLEEGTLDTEAYTLSLSDTLDWASQDLPAHAVQTPMGAVQVPAWLAPAVERCLAADPADRWSDMARLGQALEQLAPTLEGDNLALALGLHTRVAAPAQQPDHNLRAQPDAFVGRAAELATLAEALTRPGLWTLRGMAGMGKTRLATQAAWSWHQAQGGQVWFVDLNQVRTAAGLVAAVAAVLGVRLGKEDPAEQMAWALAHRDPMVLVLDNFEQLQPHADLVQGWLERATHCRFLVTSRVPLGVPGETLVDLQPLSEGDARSLLVARAVARGADVAEDPALDALAARLDGLPLALELAAGRLGVLAPADVLERLDAGILRSSEPGRHGTLQAALQWSWELLTVSEQQALTQLTVFAGGCTPAAAEDVLRLDGPVDEAVAGLVRHSLVQLSRGRIRLLPSVAAFARAQQDTAAAAIRHGQHYARLGSDQALLDLDHHGGTARQHALALELENLRLGCERARARQDTDLAIPLVRATWALLGKTGPYSEGVALLESVLALPGAERHWALWLSLAKATEFHGQLQQSKDLLDRTIQGAREDGSTWLARALCQRGWVAWLTGQVPLAADHLERALEACRALGDRDAECRTLNVLGVVNKHRGDFERSLAHFKASQALARELGDRRSEAIASTNLGNLRRQQGRLDEALAHQEHSLAIARELGDRQSEATAVGNMGMVLGTMGRSDRALANFQAWHRIARELGDRRGESIAVCSLGVVMHDLGRLDEAAAHYTEYLAVARALGNRDGEGIALMNLADVALDIQDRAAAVGYLQQAMEVFAALDNVRMQGVAHGGFARALSGQAALDHLEKAQAAAMQTGDPNTDASLMVTKAEILHHMGRAAEAQEALAIARQAASDNPRLKTAVGRAEALLAGDGAP